MDTFSFTEEQYVAKLREVIAERGDDYRYGDGESSCSYIPASYPDQRCDVRQSEDRCVHGETLSRLGVPDDQLREYEGDTIYGVLPRLGMNVSGRFQADMRRLQNYQDSGEPYRTLREQLDSMKY